MVSADQLTSSQKAFAQRLGINVEQAGAGELELVARGESVYSYYKQQGIEISPQEAVGSGRVLRDIEAQTIAEDAYKKTPEYRRAQELGLKDPVTNRVKAEQVLVADKRPAKPTTSEVMTLGASPASAEGQAFSSISDGLLGPREVTIERGSDRETLKSNMQSFMSVARGQARFKRAGSTPAPSTSVAPLPETNTINEPVFSGTTNFLGVSADKDSSPQRTVITPNYLSSEAVEAGKKAPGGSLERTQPEGPGFRPIIFDWGKFEGSKKEYRGKYVIQDGKTIPLSEAISTELAGTYDPNAADVKTQEFIATQPIVTRDVSSEYGGEVTVKLQPTTSEVIERRPTTLGEFTTEQITAYKEQGYEVKVEEQGKFYVLRATARAPTGNVFDYGAMRASLLDLGFNIRSEGKGLVASQVLSATRTTARETPKIKKMRFESQKKLQDLIESDPAAYLRIKNFKFPLRSTKITSGLPSTQTLGTRGVKPDFSKVYIPPTKPEGIITGGVGWTSAEVLSPGFARLQTEPFTRYAYQYKKYQGQMEDYWQSQPKTLTLKQKERLSKPLSNALGFLEEEKKTGVEGALRGVVRAPVEFGESVFVGAGALGGEAARYAYKGVIGEEDRGELAASRSVFGAQVGQVGVIAGSSLLFGAGVAAARGTSFGATMGKVASAVPAAKYTIPGTLFGVSGGLKEGPSFLSGKISAEEYGGYIVGSALTGAAIGGFADKYARTRGAIRARAQSKQISQVIKSSNKPYRSVSQIVEKNKDLTRTITGLGRQVKGKGFNVDTTGYSKEAFKNIGGGTTLTGQQGVVDTTINIKTPTGNVVAKASRDVVTNLGAIKNRGVGYGQFGRGYSYTQDLPIMDLPVTGTGVISSPGGAYAGAGGKISPFALTSQRGGYLPITNYEVSGAYGRYVTGGAGVIRPVTAKGFGAASSVRYTGIITDQPTSVLSDWSWASRAALPKDGVTPFVSNIVYQTSSGARGLASAESILIDTNAPTRGVAFFSEGASTSISGGGGLATKQSVASAFGKESARTVSNLVTGAGSSTSAALSSAQPALTQAYTTTPSLAYGFTAGSLSRVASTTKQTTVKTPPVPKFNAAAFLPSATASSITGASLSQVIQPVTTRKTIQPIQTQVKSMTRVVPSFNTKSLTRTELKLERVTKPVERVRAPSITRGGVKPLEVFKTSERAVPDTTVSTRVLEGLRFDRPETSVVGPVIPPVELVSPPPFGGGWTPWGMGGRSKRSWKPRAKRKYGYQPGFIEKAFNIRAKKQPKNKFFTELSSRPIIDRTLGKTKKKKQKKRSKQRGKGWFTGGRIAFW